MTKDNIINNIRVRIAPSPTGKFHIGTARTVLFNFLFARHFDGKLILRFEDTDKNRNAKESETDILEGLKWLGLNWDEGPYYQTERQDLYKKYVGQLLKEDKAYKKDGAIWFRINQQQSTNDSQLIKFKDLIHGDLVFDSKEFNDFVIIKSDGIPTFMFSNTVDDHEMKISHVIRGDEHLNNAPQQILIYQALGWEPPQFAHIPLILNKDRTKMSKRKNPVSLTQDFRDKGYFTEAMLNYIVLLGWNPKTSQQVRGRSEKEFFTLDELIKEFDLEKVNKAGAIFDTERLDYFNAHYLHQMTNQELTKQLSTFNSSKILGTGNQLLKIEPKLLEKIIEVEKNRMVKLSDFPAPDSYFFQAPKVDKKILVFKKSTLENTRKGLQLSADSLQLSEDSEWELIEELNKLLLEIVKNGGLSNGDIFWPIRVALSGQEKSPSPTELLWVLGKEESLKRINIALKELR